MQSLWMLFASAIFAVMGVCVKLASDFYSAHDILMYRGLTGVVCMIALTNWHGGRLTTPFLWHHVWRGFACDSGEALRKVSAVRQLFFNVLHHLCKQTLDQPGPQE